MGLVYSYYVRAQSEMGAAKTSAFYSLNPFIGAILGFVFLGEELNANYNKALIIMIIETIFIINDTLEKRHNHEHKHILKYVKKGNVHFEEIIHSHLHTHYLNEENHNHKHK